MLIGVIIAAAPLTLALLWWNGSGLDVLPSFADWLQFYTNVVIVAAVITLLFALLEPQLASRRPEPAEGEPPARETPESPFLDRLPPVIRDRLIALEMEDHYVRAHAPGTSVLVLLRMRDASAELAGIDGERVHRSWWVRRDAVERVAGDSRNLRLVLTGGLEAPVARDRVADLRAAGWLER
ncbi:MAG: LytTR family DNA-binding domain-containing protein [Sphingomicrobium sp.]